MKLLPLLLGLLLVMTISGPISAQEAATSTPNGIRASDFGDYRIGPEDTLQIVVWSNDAMSKTVPVRPDGKISLPLLNDVQAAGLTPVELKDFLSKQLSQYMSNPEVSVIVADVKSFKVSVIGEVSRPARYELKSATTVLEALALAGGLTPFAARSKIVVLRPDGNGMKRIPFNYNQVISKGGFWDWILNPGSGEQENFYLRNGDVVLVP